MRCSQMSIIALILTFTFSGLRSTAQTPLRNMPGPQGGNIVYGTVDGAETPPAAMGSILRRLHQQYGERPQVGRVFKVRGTDSDAVFFTLTRHSPSSMQIAGMLLVSSVPGHVEAALLSDEASRFGTSVTPMMKALFEAWKPGGKSLLPSPAGGSGRGEQAQPSEAPAAPLHPYRLQDNSAMVMLAEGWRVAPGSGGGTILAQGPHGETMALGFPYLAYDSGNPRTQRMRNFAMSPQGRSTSYAQAAFVPYAADPGRTLMQLNAHAHQVGSPSMAPLQVEQEQPAHGGGPSRCVILTGSSPGNGQPLQFEGTFCQTQPDMQGGFMNLANLAFVPPALALRERATLRAMLGSFQVNTAVVNAQAAALAQPTIDAIHEIGHQVNQRIAESDRRNAERRASFDYHNDVMDRTSQGFSNYILDQTVIQDTQNNAHGTTWNSTAEALVKSDPNRYQYVETPGYWKGIDY